MKKSMKRIVSIALILCLTLSLIPATLATSFDFDAGTYVSGESVNYEGISRQVSVYEDLEIPNCFVSASGSGLSVVKKSVSSGGKNYYYPGLTGKAGNPGTYTFTVYASGNSGSREDTYTIKVTIIGVNYKTLTANATVGVPFKQSFNYDLPAGSYTVEGDLTNASHPYNLKEYGFNGGYDSSAMTITGTPTKAGLATYTVKATNSTTGDITYIYIEINVKEPAPTTYDYGTYTFTSGDPVQIVLNKNVYTESYYSIGNVTGLTNSGLSLGVAGSGGGETLMLAGTAGKAGTYNISVPATEAGKTDIHKVTIIIKEPAQTTYDYGTYTFTSGDPVEIVLNKRIYTEGYYTTGTVTGQTNSGLALGVKGSSGGETLMIAGTAGKAGTYNISVPVTEAGKNDVHKVTVIIKAGAAEITNVVVNDIALPVAGNTPDTTASVPSGANYSVTSVQWYVDVPGTGFVTMPASEKFAEGKTYYCSVTLAPKTGYAFKHGTADSYGKAYFAGSATILVATPKDTPIVDIAKGTMVVKSGEITLQKKPDDFVNPFVDVIKGVHWFYDDVMSAVKMGLVNGMDATHYKPDDNLTIAQAIKLAACMNQYYYDKKVTLTNATSGVWYNSYVNYAITKGIITFDQFEGKYNNTATRADYVTIFAKALPESEFKAINNIADNKVPDVKSNAVYGPAVYKLYRAGILTGSGSAATYGYFLPNDPIRRSEVAAILTRMMDASTRKTVVLP